MIAGAVIERNSRGGGGCNTVSVIKWFGSSIEELEIVGSETREVE